MKNYTVLIRTALIGTLFFSVFACRDNSPEAEEENQEETWAEITGLKAPMGVTKDSKGRLWVTEGGTGNDDAGLAFISLTGQKKEVLTGLPSAIANGSVEGVGRPYIKDNSLFFTHGIGGLIYRLKGDVNMLSEEFLPLSTSDFEVIDINSFARGLPTSDDQNTNPMDLYLHTNGDLFILDSGANVIIKKANGSDELSLFAELPKIPTPAPFPVSGDAVPTGFVFDGTRFLVSTLSGVPFNQDVAKVFSISLDGQVTEYKDGFTNLIQVELDKSNKPVVLQYAVFSLEAGFQPSSGSISDENGNVLLSDLNQPIDLLRKEADTYYVLSYGDGTLKKVTL